MVAKVIVDISNSEVDRFFDYLIPNNIDLKIGAKVLVPFGPRKIEGYVIEIRDNSEYDEDKLKEILHMYDDYFLSEELINLCFYLKNVFYLRLIDCIKLCMPTVIRSGKVKHLTTHKVFLNTNDDIVNEFLHTVKKNATNQIGAVKYLQDKLTEDVVKLNKMFGSATINKLTELNVIVKEGQIIERTPMSDLKIIKKEITPTDLQLSAIKEIENQNGKVVLLHGVTGSGKTEIYLNVIQGVINKGKTAIMLVPEISLTPQMFTRVKERFGDSVAVLHSGLSNGEKHDEWVRIYNGNAKVVVGARSAIFAPLKDVGVIIIDEEHDSSYISDSNPRYDTTDVAIFRSKFNNCPLVLGSATPNIDSYYKAKSGEYKLVELPVRVHSQNMPEMAIVDMLPEFKSGNTSMFSHMLINEIEATLKKNQQVILFINRRGFASSVMCKDCGTVPECESCSVSLTYHKNENQLKCHYCGKRYRMLTQCTKCTSKNLKYGGIGTERVVHELKQLFKDTKILRMDNDTTTNKNAHIKILNEFENTKPSILVGTQMIAKGHDFPLVTLVGILDADLSLYFGAYRASEKTFQLITQVAGRAGRGEYPGKVILQTYYPKHYVYRLSANYDYKNFYEKEINLRDVTNFPPFSTVVRLLVTSDKDDYAKDTTHNLFIKLKELRQENLKEFIFLEAMRSPITKIKDKYRYQVVARVKNDKNIIKQIYDICDTVRDKNSTIFVELNPQALS